MFPDTRQNNAYQPNQQSYHKREKFRTEIRQRQIQTLHQTLRKKYITFKDPRNYQMLKNIDLNAAIKNLKYSDHYPEQCIDDMFAYSSSRQSDHLYQLFDDDVINKLVSLTFITENCKRLYNKKIMWILTNYTGYSTEGIPETYINLIEQLSRQHKIGKQPRKFDHHLLEFIVLSVANMVVREEQCRQFCEKYPNLIVLVMQSYLCVYQFQFQMISNQKMFPVLFDYYVDLFQNLLTTISYHTFQQRVINMPLIYSSLFKTLNFTFTQSNFRHSPNYIQKKIMRTLQESVIINYPNNTEFIAYHSVEIQQLTESFEKYQAYHLCDPSAAPIISYFISWLEAVYGIDTLDADKEVQQKCMNLLQNMFEDHVMGICQDIFKTNNMPLKLCILNLLDDICLEQSLCELLINNICLSCQIFRFITGENSSFNHKKVSILVVVNIIKSTLYDRSTTAAFTLQLILNNSFHQKLLELVGVYADPQIIIGTIQAIECILNYQSRNGNKKYTYYYLESILKKNIGAIYEETGNQSVKQHASNFLDYFQQLEKSLDIQQF